MTKSNQSGKFSTGSGCHVKIGKSEKQEQ